MIENNDPNQYPRIRPVEAFPVDVDGKRCIALRDPMLICEQTLYVTDFTIFVISMFDGLHSLKDIQAEITRRTGNIVPHGEIEQLVSQLDASLLLDTPGYRNHLATLQREYAAQSMRAPTHAGLSYEADPAALAAQLDAFYENIVPARAPRGTAVRGLISPHIDVKIGGPCFAAAFDHLRGCDTELFIILGTAHNYAENPFTLAARDFDTPLGAMLHDPDAAQRLRDQFGDALCNEEYNHRNEHSIEFQCLFLRHILGPRHPARILPIYVSSMHELLTSNIPFYADPGLREMAAALRGIASRQSTCFIAGVDLAHVGLRFNDPQAPDQAMLDHIRQRDMALAHILEQRDAHAYYQHFLEDMDARHVCGMSAMALFLAVLDADTAVCAGIGSGHCFQS